MVYTKDYYRVLDLPSPQSLTTSTSSSALDPDVLRSKYREALLRAHPDKQSPARRPQTPHPAPSTGRTNQLPNPPYPYTVDDVREAFAVLSDAAKRREYHAWLRATATTAAAAAAAAAVKTDEDFILGLEVLDLSDFEEVVMPASSSSSPSSSEHSTSTSNSSRCSSSSSSASPHVSATSGGQAGDNGETETETEWHRACRCGVAPGFVIREAELESAVQAGEAEVLVGCAGCSLWVRVGFGVDEG
jgi:diphthamide biosynthesis protein 4